MARKNSRSLCLSTWRVIPALGMLVALPGGAAAVADSVPRVSSASTASAAALTTLARPFVQSVAEKGLTILSNTSSTDSEKKALFRGMLEENFDLPGIARFVLGPGQALTSAQYERYVKLFEEMILSIYFDQLKLLVIKNFAIKSVSAPDEDQRVTVDSTVMRTQNNDPVDVRWVVLQRPDHALKIYDVVVSDISLSVIQAREIRGLLAREGSVEAFLDALAAKFSPPPAPSANGH